MKIGIAQINTTAGDLTGNSTKILHACKTLSAQSPDLIAFPLTALTGAPLLDLASNPHFHAAATAALQHLAASCKKIPLLLGNSTGTPVLLQNGTLTNIAGTFTLNSQKISVLTDNFTTTPQPSDLIIHLPTTPWHFQQTELRRLQVAQFAQSLRTPLIQINPVGANDSTIYDGRSLVISNTGTLTHSLAAFTEDLQVIDLSDSTTQPAHTFSNDDPLADLYSALTLGIRDYAQKSGFKKILIALSGGIDSALVAALAVNALGPQNVIGYSLPSEISSDHSKADALALAKNLHIPIHTLPIADIVASAEKTLAPLLATHPRDTTEENLQARARGILMMALSNKLNALVLTTGNKSEASVGYCTLYGDTCGGLAPIGDIYKTQVFALSRWINRHTEIIPWNTINKAPSAELRPNQFDQDSLPPYDQLDAILAAYLDNNQSLQQLLASGHPEPLVRDVLKKIHLNEYKRRQAPPILRVSNPPPRLPIIHKFTE